MTCKEQVKILDDKIKANKRQYDLDGINAKISAYSRGDLPKYEYLTKKNLGYKPDPFEQVKFEYSPLGKIFTDGLAKEDKSKNIGLFKRLKNIEDNLVEVDDKDNKVGIFQIIKDIKDKGIKIDNDDEAVREIRERIKELIDDGVKVNNFDEMKKEIMEHILNLEKQGIEVKINEDQINNLIDKIFNKKDADLKNKKDANADKDEYLKKILSRYVANMSINYGENKFSTKHTNKLLTKFYNKRIEPDEFIAEYNNKFRSDVEMFKNAMSKKNKVLLPLTKEMC